MIDSFFNQLKEHKTENPSETVFVELTLAENQVNRLCKEYQKQKEILDIFKKACKNRVFFIEKVEERNGDKYEIHDGVSNGIDITKEQYKLFKEWLEND